MTSAKGPTRDEAVDSPARRGTKTIVAKYGLIFGFEPHRPYLPEEMGSCPVGWLGMFERTVQRLIRLGWDRRLDQIKVKGTTARMYVRTSTRPMETVIARFVARSAKVCASCGARADKDSPGFCSPHSREVWPDAHVVVRHRRRGNARKWKGIL